MADLDVTPERVTHLAGALRLNATRVRVLDTHYAGGLSEGDSPRALTVGGEVIMVPADAVIQLRTRDSRTGIEINLDVSPAPPGIWLRVQCDAVRQSNAVFEALRDL